MVIKQERCEGWREGGMEGGRGGGMVGKEGSGDNKSVNGGGRGYRL